MAIKAVLLNDTSAQNHYGCRLVVHNIQKCANKAGLEIVASVPVDRSWRERVYLEAINECDVVIVNGEGTLHSSKRRAVELSEIGPYCQKISKPCFLINSVYQNNNEVIAGNLNQFTCIYVRESYSKKELESQGVAAHVVPDMIFYSNPFDYCKAESSEVGALFSGSMYKDVSNAIYALSSKYKGARFVTLWQKPVLNHRSMNKKSVKRKLWDGMKPFFPFKYRVKVNRFFGTQDRQYDFDVDYHSTNGLDDLLGIIKGSGFIFTGYFHFTCLAMMAKKPFRCIPSNTHKIEGMLCDAGLTGRVLRLKDFDSFSFLDFSESELNNLEAYLGSMPKKADEMMEIIFNSAI